MPWAWQLKMGSPIPGEFMALISHNTVRGYNKHREEGQREMVRCCLYALSALYFSYQTEPWEASVSLLIFTYVLLVCYTAAAQGWLRPGWDGFHSFSRPIWALHPEANSPFEELSSPWNSSWLRILPSTRPQCWKCGSCSMLPTRKMGSSWQSNHFQWGLAFRGK